LNIDHEELRMVLKAHPNGIFLDDILNELHLEVKNVNRIHLVSILKWENVERCYRYRFGKLKTVFLLKQEKILEES